MTNTEKSVATSRHHQFTTRALFVVMALVAWILGVNRWLGPPFGWMTAIPLTIVAFLVLFTRGWATLGAMVGFVVLGLLGYFVIIQWDKSDPRFIKSLVCVASFGSAAGGSIQALLMKRWILGSLSLLASFVTFAAISMISI